MALLDREGLAALGLPLVREDRVQRGIELAGDVAGDFEDLAVLRMGGLTRPDSTMDTTARLRGMKRKGRGRQRGERVMTGS